MYNHRDFLAELTSGQSTKVLHGNGGLPRTLTTDLMHDMEHAIELHGDRAERIGCGAEQVRAFERLFDANSQRLHHQAPFRGCAWNRIPILLDTSVPPDMMVWFRDGVAVGVIADLQTEEPQIHIERIEVHADDPDRLAFGIAEALRHAKAPQELQVARRDFDRAAAVVAKPVCACGDPKCGQPRDEPPVPIIGGPPGGPSEIGGLTPGECRDRWEANAAAIESGMARPYALSPEQIAEGKRMHLEARKAGR